MFGAFSAVILSRLYPWSLFLTVPLVIALAWSRWRLERHTPAEIAVGLLLGTAAGLFTAFA
jgi:membrane-associated phospholipid phosphatase